MKPFHNRHTAFAVSAFALLLATACNRADTSGHDENTQAPAATSESASSAAPAAEAAASHAFDATSLPVSDAPLGEFPYLGLPDGYQARNPTTGKFERVPFWTGDRLQWIEGRVYGSGIAPAQGHEYSQLELARNVQALVEQLGGRHVGSGRIAQQAIAEILKSPIAVDHVDGLGDIYNEAVDTYVIRRADRDIWIQLTRSGHAGGWLIAESRPVAITAKALPADTLMKSLEAHGNVALDIRFETDQATILPASKPQLEQVIKLLNDAPQLRLSINGHTDNSGDAAHNLQLSQQRAHSVSAYLQAAGISSKRLESSGFGDTRPVAENSTEEGKARNRRVELVKV